jgi:hypothetical protein
LDLTTHRKKRIKSLNSSGFFRSEAALTVITQCHIL